eukprot:989853_1
MAYLSNNNSTKYKWEWYSQSSGWKEYDKKLSNAIDNAYSKNVMRYCFKIRRNDTKYEIDFDHMKQCNMNTMKERIIRRVPLPSQPEPKPASQIVKSKHTKRELDDENKPSTCSAESKIVSDKPVDANVGNEYGMVVDTSGNDANDAKKQEPMKPCGFKDDDDDDKCQLEFERFLSSMPKLIGQHLDTFKQNGYNDIRYVTVLDLETLKDEIGMKGPHAKIFMNRIVEYQTDYKKFALFLNEVNMKEKYHMILENAGIATYESYYHHIKSMDDLRLLINDENDISNIWG